RLSARQLAAEAFIKTQEPRSAFARIDKDGSGTVDMEELRQYLLDHGLREEHLEELFARLDLDKDGHISQAEFQEGFQAFIALKSMSGQVISEIIQNVEKFTKSSQLKKA
ncbi:Calcium-dependent protein kinase 6 (Calcium-dependent protein kinase isoform CDPK3) (AtCDPK3) (Calmodulin-domain protein kinase CDPK isoform 6), partial [Durusdinium trenchii]